MDAVEPELKSLVGNAVESLGYEMLGVEYQPRKNNSLLRVYIDSEQGITVDDCQRVSNQISGVLDVEDPIPGHYTLEVSSPGLDRPLFEKAHYERFQGEEIRVKTLVPVSGRRNFKGVLVTVKDDGIVIRVDKEEYEIAFADIRQARLVPGDL